MQVTRWDPFTALARLDRDFDELIRRTWGESAQRRGVTGFVPAVEVVREDGDVLVRFELPGVDVDRDVEITVHKGRLIVTGERRSGHSEDTCGVVVRELRYGSFRREFALPEGVTAEQVDASYDAGMLTVRVRNAVPAVAEPVRVPVQSAPAPAVEQAADEQAADEQPQS